MQLKLLMNQLPFPAKTLLTKKNHQKKIMTRKIMTTKLKQKKQKQKNQKLLYRTKKKKILRHQIKLELPI